jgi:Uncharacterized membrane-associated protein
VLMIAAALASSPPPLPGFLNALSGTLQHFGLWAIGLLITLEDFGVPVPGETILIAGAIFAGAGRINIVALGVVAFVAAVAGDNIGFAIGHFGGRALALRFGKYVFLTEERLNKAENFFDRRGSIVITFARFVEGLRQANGIIAGITGMHWLRFLFSTPSARRCGWGPGSPLATSPETTSPPSTTTSRCTRTTCSPAWWC